MKLGVVVNRNTFYRHLGPVVEAALARGLTIVLELEVRGARVVMQEYPEAESIFVMPPDMAELRRRLEGRRTESSEAVEERLAIAKKEMAEREHYRHVIVNRDLTDAVREAREIVMQAKEAELAGPQDN